MKLRVQSIDITSKQHRPHPQLLNMSQESADVAEVAIVELVSFCITHLGLQGLACLAACSRELHNTCLGLVQSHANSLLAEAVKAVQSAHATQRSSNQRQKEHSRDLAVQEQHRQAVVWLLRAAPALAAAATTADLLSHVPNVPTGWELQLVEAGVRITYTQLLAAAHSMVAGVEVWVQAQQQLGVQTDIPKWAVAVCCKCRKVRVLWLWRSIATVVFLCVIEFLGVRAHGSCTPACSMYVEHEDTA
jgi:hypothetical protein